MGFFNRVGSVLKDAANAAGVGTHLDRFNNKSEVDAFVRSFAYVATADAELEKEERAAVGKFFANSPAFASFDKNQVVSDFNKYADWGLDDMLRPNLLSGLRNVGADSANRVLASCVGLAKSDGEFEPEERVAIQELAQAFGVGVPVGV